METRCATEIIALLTEELGLNDQKMRPLFLEWLYEAQKEIGNIPAQLRETEWLPIQYDFRINKPKDYFLTRELIIKGSGKFNCPVHPRLEARERITCCLNANAMCDITMKEYPGYFGLSSNSQNYTHYKLLYLSMPIGDDGLPEIDEKCVKASRQYVLYKYLQRQRRINVNDVPLSEIEMNYKLWARFKDEAWARVMSPDDNSLRTIAKAAWYSGVTARDFGYAMKFYGLGGAYGR